MQIARFFRTPALSDQAMRQVVAAAEKRLSVPLGGLATEWCYYVGLSDSLNPKELAHLRWLLSETFQPNGFSKSSFLADYPTVLEVGPRLNFETVFSSTAVDICHNCGIPGVIRLERSTCYGLPVELSTQDRNVFLDPLFDLMTQQPYPEPLASFDHGLRVEPVQIIPLIERGIEVLKEINTKLGLAMDEQDLVWCCDLFVNQLKRNPTDVELFQLGQGVSEHCRHPYWKGRRTIDGVPAPQTLMEMVQEPLLLDPKNSIIYFGDDSSALRGGPTTVLIPAQPGVPSRFRVAARVQHSTLTAETHNHPTKIEPYEGAATGTGGRIRDNRDVGRGALMLAGGVGYGVGNLKIPGYSLPWENDGWSRLPTELSPLEILIPASNGAYGYGNCTGEPTIYGFLRTFGVNLPDGFRIWEKPLLYTVGQGQIDDAHTKAGKPEKGMLVVQIGGPAFRIGIGGGSASSMISGESTEELDFASVQRGNPAMGNMTGRVIHACVELGEDNPIVVSHDLGAGGDCNALTEIVDPAGARINLRIIPLGDKTLSVCEYWGNESQERDTFLIWPERYKEFKAICDREGVSCVVAGEITGDGQLVVYDEQDGTTPVNLPLGKILGELPQKTFDISRIPPVREPLTLPDGLSVLAALDRVLRLPSVADHTWLATKVDGSVTGRVVQQQRVGPNGIPLSDYAVTARSYSDFAGTATSIGEQPIKGLISPRAMARLTVAEAVLNMAGVVITGFPDIKCEANWMLAAKLPGEGAWLQDAMDSLRTMIIGLGGVEPDGGKDSLSMAAKMISPQGKRQVVKAPGELVIAAYASVPDITCRVQPFLRPGDHLLHIDLSRGARRLGGSALAQVYGQVGNDCPDVEDAGLLRRTFEAVQELVKKRLITAVHDISDGGLITTVLEMAFAGNVGLCIDIDDDVDTIIALFSEEPGLVLGFREESREAILEVLGNHDVPGRALGCAPGEEQIMVRHNQEVVLDEPMVRLRAIWMETSSKLNALQGNPETAAEEFRVMSNLVTPPPYRLTFEPRPTPPKLLGLETNPRVAILRAKSSNGDREMAAAFFTAGLDPWDVTMSDLIEGRITLDQFQVIAFVGGFADGDVLDSGKGWAGSILFNERVTRQFREFYQRPDTLSFGVCNGCQLMALLGWIPWYGLEAERQPRFIRNKSGRFESRFVAVRIKKSPATMLQDMAGSVLGAWVAHGEGHLHVPEEVMLERIVDEGLAPIRFVGTDGQPTETYPFNVNGSPLGIAALCSPDGRHLAMMPHAERSFLKWQWAWMPDEWQDLAASPWLRMFQNARAWAIAARQITA